MALNFVFVYNTCFLLHKLYFSSYLYCFSNKSQVVLRIVIAYNYAILGGNRILILVFSCYFKIVMLLL